MSEPGKSCSVADIVTDWVEAMVVATESVPLLMLSGAQGIGKTTALRQLVGHATLNIAVLSLDDFYHTKAERQLLAHEVHPLCATRGAPGTHDVALLSNTIDALQSAGADSVVSWPAFEKASDDRAAQKNSFMGRPDAVLLEGWMLGVRPDAFSPASEPINELEVKEDPNGVWRAWQERALEADYLPLWQRAEGFLHLLAPSFETVFAWRCEQEETTLGLEKGGLPDERRAWVAHFIQHYERITRRMLAGQRMQGATCTLDAARQVVEKAL